MDGFYLHVLYQSFNVKPSNFVKNKQTKTTKMQLKKKSKEKSKMELFFILRFFFPSIIQQLIIVNWVL